MKPILLGALLVAVSSFILIRLATCFEDPTTSELNGRVANIAFDSADDVEYVLRHAASADRAVIFVDDNWNPATSRFRRTYIEFATAYHALYPKDHILFHYVRIPAGISPQSYPWPDELRDAVAGSNGSGEVVWMKDGQVLDVVSICDFAKVNDIIHRTRWVMPQDE